MPPIINPVPFKCDEYYRRGHIVTHNGEVYVAPDDIPPSPFDRSKWSIMWDYHHLIEKINELQYQHWMDRAKLFEEMARVQSYYGEAGLHFIKYKKFRHAAEVCKKVAHERYGA